VWREELTESFDDFARWCIGRFPLEVLDVEDIGASIASGRRPTLGMLVVPCSMDTLSAIATGRSTNLLERAADVTMKEGRTLTLVPRESPLSPIHLENLWKLSRLGVRIVLPVPAFYLKPTTVDEVVDDVVGRAIGTLGIRDLLEESE
jgi:4-hydroxy-3-polyprenylbenzoate decarboxylase